MIFFLDNYCQYSFSSQYSSSLYWLTIRSCSLGAALWLPTAPQGQVNYRDQISLYTAYVAIYVTNKVPLLFTINTNTLSAPGPFVVDHHIQNFFIPIRSNIRDHLKIRSRIKHQGSRIKARFVCIVQ